MPTLKFTDFAQTTVVTAPSGASGTSMTLAPGTGALFPALAVGEVFPAVIESVDGLSREAVMVTAITGDTLTVTRSASPVVWTGTGQTFYLAETAAARTLFTKASEHTVAAATGLAAGTVQSALETLAAFDLTIPGALALLAPKDTPTFSGTSTFSGPATFSNTAAFSGAATFTAGLTANTATVSGNASVGGTLGVTGAATMAANASVGGTLGVTGATTLTGGATVGSTLNLSAGTGSLRIGGTITKAEVSGALIASVPFVDTVAHGGPRVPDVVQVSLKCVVADRGYAVGDEVPFDALSHYSGGGVFSANPIKNATQVGLRIFSNLPSVVFNDATNLGGVTANSWRVMYRCLWF